MNEHEARSGPRYHKTSEPLTARSASISSAMRPTKCLPDSCGTFGEAPPPWKLHAPGVRGGLLGGVFRVDLCSEWGCDVAPM